MTPDGFWSRVSRTDTCWLWTGSRNPNGYGNVRWGGRMSKAHRVSYEMAHGPIPDGLPLDHLCRTPACVNPDHLEPVTMRVNALRAVGAAWQLQGAKTHCPSGHAYDEHNTITRPTPNGGTRRYCRACRRGERAPEFVGTRPRRRPLDGGGRVEPVSPHPRLPARRPPSAWPPAPSPVRGPGPRPGQTSAAAPEIQSQGSGTDNRKVASR